MAKKAEDLFKEFESQGEYGAEDLINRFESESEVDIPKEPTLEKEMGFERLYGVAEPAIKAAGVVGKLTGVPTLMATGLETITGGPSAGLKALEEETSQWQPTEKASFAHQFRKLPELSEPIMETPQKDVAQGEKVKAAAKLWLSKNFPKAYGLTSKISPADIIGMGGDIATGEIAGIGLMNPTVKAAGKVGTVAINKAVNNAEKAIERMSSLSGENAAEASNMLKTRKAALTAMEYNLTSTLKDPNKLSEALNGTRDIVPDELTGKTSVKTSPGLIDNLTNHVNGIADEISAESEPINIKLIANKVYDEMAKKISDPNSGATWNSKVSEALKNRINDFFKTTPHDLPDAEAAMMAGRPDEAIRMQAEYNTSNKRDFKSLVKLKRAAADKVYEINKNPEIYGVEGATDKAVFKQIWDEIDNSINNMAKGGNDKVKELIRYNSDLSDMLHLKNMTQKARLEGMASISVPEMIAGTAATTAVGSAFGFPLAGLGYVPARAAMKMGETNIPAYLAPAQEVVGKIAYNTVTGKNQLARLPGRMAGISMATTKRTPLPMQLVEYQIPRNSDQILQNKDVVIAKIAQMSDNPVMTDMFRDALEKHPEKLPKVLPALIMQFPDLFEPDDYNRVDNKILDPQMKQKALKDIENSKILDIRTKAFKAKRLQEEGIYE